VLDGSTLLSAPQISAMLADFGAEVVKIEPPDGDPLRQFGADAADRKRLWAYVNRGKSTRRIDLQTPAGQSEMWKWLAWADVAVFNSPLSRLQQWGIGWGDVHAALPDLVVAVVSCYGAEGPMATVPGNGTLAEAFGGLTNLTGEADGPPMLTSIPLGDTLTAMSGVIGVLTASMAKQLGNAGGQLVDIAMYEPVLHLLGPIVAEWDGIGEPPKRRGNRLPEIPLRNLYRCSDGQWVAVSATTDRQACRLLELTGFADLGSVATVADRIARADELEDSVCRWAEGRMSAEALRLLEERRIAASPVLDLAQIASHPHIRARRSVYPRDGMLRVAATPTLSETPGDSSRNVGFVAEMPKSATDTP